MGRISQLIAALAIVASSHVSWGESELVDGQATKIDEAAGKITIRHGPIKKFQMEEGMTMVYRVQDPTLLKTVKAGDKVKFEMDQINGQFTVLKIQKTK